MKITVETNGGGKIEQIIDLESGNKNEEKETVFEVGDKLLIITLKYNNADKSTT